MDVRDFVRRYPELYHMAELGSWPSIQKRGLRSTTKLLDLFEVESVRRVKLESEWRPRSETIRHPNRGTAVIRDQRPMRDEELKPLLIDMEPRDWYRLINGKVFFWADLHGLRKLLGAVMYRDRSHDVLTVDTGTLVERHVDKMWLTDQNSGSVLSGRPRGRDTFKKVRDFSGRWVTEVAVDNLVPDIADLTIRVEEWKGDTMVRQIWLRGARGGSV